MGFANWLSHRSKLKTFDGNFTFYHEKEFLIQHCRSLMAAGDASDYYVFGHRHLPMLFDLGGNKTYANLGDWIGYNTYAVYDGTELKIETFEG